MSDIYQWFDVLLAWAGTNPSVLGWLFGFSLLLFVGSLVLIPMLITRMRPDYFVTNQTNAHNWFGRHQGARIAVRVVKNIVGLALLLAGFAMMVLPGQGIITVLVALSLLEFPGKRRLEQRLIKQPAVHKSMNWIRSRSGQSPLMVPDE